MKYNNYFDKIWRTHVVTSLPSSEDLLYIDSHLLHEVSSPQAFSSLKEKGRSVRRPDKTYATSDHIIPTKHYDDQSIPVKAKELLTAMVENTASNDIQYYQPGSPDHGIVHVIALEHALVSPGMTAVCGDSHTCTLGAIGALGWGIGTSQVEHVLCTQTLPMKKPEVVKVVLSGALSQFVTAKDIILYLIRTFGVTFGSNKALEFIDQTETSLSVEQRATICNMGIEMGARFALFQPDSITADFMLEVAARRQDKNIICDPQALMDSVGDSYCNELLINISHILPQITWGTTPEEAVDVNGLVPAIDDEHLVKNSQGEFVHRYMGVKPNVRINQLSIDYVFIGSCTNGRYEDLKATAQLIKGHHVSNRVKAIIVPGSQRVKERCEAEGIDRVFTDAGFEWHMPGCSMCISINGDLLPPYARCVSTANRNFEGRQGNNVRTHIASPLTAAVCAIKGRIASPYELEVNDAAV
ncbi:3-isopropylmalate dehydratase large subunit [Pseudoalteromonas sp. S16_S37]|uniref:3-isopropylmalate dehydratase large subunit n=1 Tax=Pseudoalteromonas sp. S16_S37 TaxID=2720228 RepID=UPI0016805825|nr:3-isopropylmalate dehydratase large subunit [Pseudoalteromonas sp. S16_S37]MBD1583639.1 3-isopropylmalate dehydratase large subunit [Pseudoalteromonas sp. S16_S37]